MKRNFSVQLPLTEIERMFKRRVYSDTTVQNTDASASARETDKVQQGTEVTDAKQKEIAAVGMQVKSKDKRTAKKSTPRKAIGKTATSTMHYPVGKRTAVSKGDVTKLKMQQVKAGQVHSQARSTIKDVTKSHESKEVKDANVLSVPEDMSVRQPKAARYHSDNKS